MGAGGLLVLMGGGLRIENVQGEGSPYSGLPLTLVILTVAYVIHVLSSIHLNRYTFTMTGKARLGFRSLRQSGISSPNLVA